MDIANPKSSDGWQEATKWPQLQTNTNPNYRQGCTKFGNYIVIAGGREGPWNTGTTIGVTEVLDLSTKTMVIAGEMILPRYNFHLATMRRNGQQMLFGLGGLPQRTPGGNPSLDSVEQFFPSNSTWTSAPPLMEGRHEYSVVVISKELVCPTTAT